MWLFLFGVVVGLLMIPLINLALTGGQSNRVIAVVGLVTWPFQSLYVAVFKRKEKRAGARKSFGRIWYQLRTNKPFFLRKEK
jgi:hypothetical protein